MNPSKSTHLTLRALIITFLIAFGFYLLAELGLLRSGLMVDKSHISSVILAIYVLATGHWLWLTRSLSRERQALSEVEAAMEEGEAWPSVPTGRVGFFLAHLRKKSDSDAPALLEALGDELSNRHALGHFVSDLLLKLGLVGTVVGFILMLIPVGEMDSFDPKLMQAMLAAMSGGMSVALYTTLAGLVTSTLLKAQYYLLDSSVAEMINRLTFLASTHTDSDAA
ncbi:MAG: MotA/TolQ/ExbB proton channel family protein [Myxococcota bacterium]|nr:MotA/TolQ/ExbB proton channel family protein [Myxococcota bacterium]